MPYTPNMLTSPLALVGRRALLAPLAALALTGCATTAMDAPIPIERAPDSAIALDALFAAYDQAGLEMSPVSKSYRGIRDEDYGSWDDVSDAGEQAEYALLQETAQTMRADFDPSALSDQERLSYRLFDAMAERREALWPYREYDYIFDQMRGEQSQLPAFLINIHRVSDIDEARAYVSRIEGLGPVLETLTAESRERAGRGIMPPDWVYPRVISDIENLLSAGADNAVLEDFEEKVDALDIPVPEAEGLKRDALVAWNASARPAYEQLLAEMRRQQQIAPTDDGIWRLPDGEGYYAALLANYTTTDLTADQIHAIGLREVDRIHDEMRGIMQQVGFEGACRTSSNSPAPTIASTTTPARNISPMRRP